ncbi:MAG TPA: methylmalonyl Co-A mutase-associated GTPase MeaB [Planctomycetota bacterium]|nr:methylmalonyl Co-A mutase-associated GTPase MeaB [Planctomycetota bacterium]
MLEGVKKGDPLAVSRAISAAENAAPEGRALLDAIAPLVGRAIRFGFTGPPGVGKSTTIDSLVQVLRAGGERVGVIAVDPTSPFTGGALLGDRIRMGKSTEDAGVFMRSMATRGSTGGLSRATQDAADILDASGAARILIETVGVGQSEVEIARAADLTVVILSPESGDGIQAMKSGILEIADLVLINKADRIGADKLEQDLRGAFDLRPSRREADIPILHSVAFQGKGIPELLNAMDLILAERRNSGAFDRRRLANMVKRLRSLAEYMIERDLWKGAGGRLESMATDVLNHSKTSYQAAELLVHEALKTR